MTEELRIMGNLLATPIVLLVIMGASSLFWSRGNRLPAQPTDN